jgi:hypothetical protein
LKEYVEVEAGKVPRMPLHDPKVESLVHIEVNQKLLRGSIVAIKDKKCRVELLDLGKKTVI